MTAVLPRDPGAPSTPAPELGREAEALRRGLERAGAMAVLCLETEALLAVEQRHGAFAWCEVAGRVGGRLRHLLEGHLREDDRVVQGELGRGELLVFLFRGRDDAAFYRSELPALVRDLQACLAPPGNHLGYPFLRSPLRIAVGSVVLFHDPALRPERALRRACELAGEDAQLAARLAARGRREALLDLLLHDRLAIALEPIVRLADCTPVGWEALVRGPARSELATPAALFAAAAEAELTFELDCRCRRAALGAATRVAAGTRLFVNCLPSAIHDPAFQDEALRRTLQARGLRPRDVVFEISEHESIANWDLFREVRDHYATLGFGIALDDVGAGYGSLEAVAELRPDYVKVDLAFVRGIESDPARQEVLRALGGVARRIGAELVAEGVETAEQLATLRRLGVPLGQGFLFRDDPRLQPGEAVDSPGDA